MFSAQFASIAHWLISFEEILLSRFTSVLICASAILVSSIVTGCGGAPSESEIKSAFEKQMAADIKGLQSMPGGSGALMKSIFPEIKLTKKIGCKDDGERAYRCDVEMEVTQGGATRKAPMSLRVVKGSDGWMTQMVQK